MKTFTYSDFAKFIRNQPDDREIKMQEISGGNSCGCVLVQFGREFCQLKGNFEEMNSFPIKIREAKRRCRPLYDMMLEIGVKQVNLIPYPYGNCRILIQDENGQRPGEMLYRIFNISEKVMKF